MYFDMANILLVYEGIMVDQGGSSPTALIKIRKIERLLGTQNGYQNTRQT